MIQVPNGLQVDLNVNQNSFSIVTSYKISSMGRPIYKLASYFFVQGYTVPKPFPAYVICEKFILTLIFESSIEKK